jgi:hypothetical protein
MKRKINSKLISGFKKFRKMNKEILVVEIIGKISPKIVITLENQECDLEWILEYKNFGRGFLDSNENSEKSNMLCYEMQP